MIEKWNYYADLDSLADFVLPMLANRFDRPSALPDNLAAVATI